MAPRIAFAVNSSPAHGVNVVWAVSGPEQVLRSWDAAALGKLKTVSSHEKSPVDGKMTSYKGVQLSQVIDQSMESLAVERKAQVDLIVFRNASGGQVLVPRSVVTKYSGMLSPKDDKLALVMPWTSKPKLMQEGLPVETYFLPDVSSIELSSYQERFGSLFLKRRTDPVAMRGEKIYVQNCISCHSAGNRDTVNRGLASGTHPMIKGSPKLNDRDQRALAAYLDMYRAENGAKPAIAGK